MFSAEEALERRTPAGGNTSLCVPAASGGTGPCFRPAAGVFFRIVVSSRLNIDHISAILLIITHQHPQSPLRTRCFAVMMLLEIISAPISIDRVLSWLSSNIGEKEGLDSILCPHVER